MKPDDGGIGAAAKVAQRSMIVNSVKQRRDAVQTEDLGTPHAMVNLEIAIDIS